MPASIEWFVALPVPRCRILKLDSLREQALCGQRGLIESAAQQRCAVTVEFIGPGRWQLSCQGVALVPGFVGFREVAFDPVKGAVGLPVIRVEARWAFPLHAFEPCPCGSGVVTHISAGKDE